jgi:hypothetical protein
MNREQELQAIAEYEAKGLITRLPSTGEIDVASPLHWDAKKKKYTRRPTSRRPGNPRFWKWSHRRGRAGLH